LEEKPLVQIVEEMAAAVTVLGKKEELVMSHGSNSMESENYLHYDRHTLERVF
jgi:hypothetical protein